MSVTLWYRSLGSLRPADEDAERALNRMAQGEVVKCEVSRPRNIAFFRRYWVGMGIIAKQLEGYTKEEVSDTVLIMVGHCNTFRTKATATEPSEVIHSAKSISFAAMTEDDFSDLWQRVVACICEKIIPGLNDAVFESEIASIIGLSTAAVFK